MGYRNFVMGDKREMAIRIQELEEEVRNLHFDLAKQSARGFSGIDRLREQLAEANKRVEELEREKRKTK